MRLVPLAFDSMGVRSMCCFIEGEPPVLLDPGVSLAPKRFGLPPHPSELQQLMKKRRVIQEYARKTDIITISHWHNDHHTPFMTGLFGSVTPDAAEALYRGKPVMAKGIHGLNVMQKKRAQSFLRHHSYTTIDGTSFTFKNVTVKGSHPVAHGALTKIPVVMVSVTGDKKVVHASDTQGLAGVSFIKEEAPDILVLSGPPGSLLSPEEISTAESAILDMVDCCSQVILDHHHVREKSFKQLLPEVWKSPKVKTAAEYAGEPTMLLEAHRKELFTPR
jgi:hypothetical protein